MKTIKLRPEDIRIHEAIKPPKYATLEAKRRLLSEGRDILPAVTPEGVLVDGYAGYLALLERDPDRIRVLRCGDTAMLAVGVHGRSAKEYAWWVPPSVRLGGSTDLLVDTRFGPRRATLVRTEECGWDEALRHRRVLGRVEGEAGDGRKD